MPRFGELPWLPLLPPEAKGSLHKWGRYLFSQTPACKRGSMSIDSFDSSMRASAAQGSKTFAGDVLVRCCLSFSLSPLSIVIDIRAAMQCINLAVKQLLAVKGAVTVLPSMTEAQLDHVCAAGCGKDLSQGHTHIPQYGDTLKYCSQECADKVSVLIHVAAYTRTPSDSEMRQYVCIDEVVGTICFPCAKLCV